MSRLNLVLGASLLASLCLHASLAVEPFHNKTYIQQYEGKVALLTCWKLRPGQASEQDLNWYKSGSPDQMVISKLVDNTITYGDPSWPRSDIRIVNSQDLEIRRLKFPRDQGKFKCLVNENSFVDVNVLAPVKSVSIRITNHLHQGDASTLNVTDGVKTTLECRAEGGNPPPAISWVYGTDNMDNLRNTSTIGKAFSRSDGVTQISCQSTNGVLGHAPRATATLNIQYAPTTLEIVSSQRTFSVKEDTKLTLTCRSDGNPSPSVYWTHQEIAVGQSAEVTFRSVSRSDAGKYTCHAENTIGNIYPKGVNISVLYPPSITLEYKEKWQKLICRATAGFPESYRFDPWEQRVGGMLVRTVDGQREDDGTYVLDLNNTTYASNGDYTCLVSNGANGKQKSVRHVTVLAKPAFQPQKHVFGLHLNQLGQVSIRYFSHPLPSEVKWYKKTDQLQPAEIHGTWYKLKVRDLVFGMPVNKGTDIISNVDGKESVLTIERVQPSHFGNYTVVVRNDEGSAHFDFVISEAEKEAPIITLVGILALVLTVLMLITVAVVLCLRRKRKMPSGTEKQENETKRTVSQFGTLPKSGGDSGSSDLSNSMMYLTAQFRGSVEDPLYPCPKFNYPGDNVTRYIPMTSASSSHQPAMMILSGEAPFGVLDNEEHDQYEEVYCA